MNKYLLIDTREKTHAIQTILKTIDEAGIEHVSTKLLFGDYADYNNPGLVIDRKQSIQELAANCTRDHERFKRELERAKTAGARLVILVEQNRYKDRDKWIHVEDVSDLMLWSSPHTTIRGEKVFRVLRAWMAKYDIDVVFCDKRQTGQRILEILYDDSRVQ